MVGPRLWGGLHVVGCRSCGKVGVGGHGMGGETEGQRWGAQQHIARGGGGGVPGCCGGPCVWGGLVWGRRGEALSAILARGHWPFPMPRRPVLGG